MNKSKSYLQHVRGFYVKLINSYKLACLFILACGVISSSLLHQSASSTKKIVKLDDSWVPDKLYSFEELAICGPTLTRELYIMPASMENNTCLDQSCLGCVSKLEPWAQETYEYVQWMRSKFRDEENVRSIVNEAEKKIGTPAEGNVMTIIAFSKEFFRIILNWSRSPQIREEDYLLFANDEEAFALAKNAGLELVKPFWFHKSNNHFRTAVILQAFAAAVLVDAGYNVLLQDADVMWAKDPRPWMLSKSENEGSDFLVQLAPRFDQMGPLNTGLVFISNRRKRVVKWFMRHLVHIFPLIAFTMGDDQQIWNVMYKHVLFRPIHFSLLPRKEFSFAHENVKNPITVHAVGQKRPANVHKENSLRDVGLWYLKD